MTFLKTRISQFYPECDVETNNTEQLDIGKLKQNQDIFIRKKNKSIMKFILYTNLYLDRKINETALLFMNS